MSPRGRAKEIAEVRVLLILDLLRIIFAALLRDGGLVELAHATAMHVDRAGRALILAGNRQGQLIE
jgi:hypothetical protein